MTMTPEQIEAILQSNAKAIASNSDTIAEVRREVSGLYQIASELVRDRATMYDILRSLNEDRLKTSENLAAIAENVARIANALEQRND